MLDYFTKGIDLSDRRLTRDRRIWVEYLCWCISSKLWGGVCWPRWFRVFIYRQFGKNIVYIPILHPIKRWLRFCFGSCTGGRSHRCEFTDKKCGALYGGNAGPFMDNHFDHLIKNISLPEDD